MSLEINEIRRLRQQAQEAEEARHPRPLSEQELQERIKSRIDWFLKEIEKSAACGGSSARVPLAHNVVPSTILGEYYIGDYIHPKRNLGYYSKKEMAYYCDPGHLTPISRRFYDAIEAYFTKAGFTVCIEYRGVSSDESPMVPAICVCW